MACMSLSMSPKVVLDKGNTPTTMMMETCKSSNMVAFKIGRQHRLVVARAAASDKLSEVVEESIKNAAETCAESPQSWECAAAWDEVEEVSAAASHARNKSKAESDPLEKYCADNPETVECRTYDN